MQTLTNITETNEPTVNNSLGEFIPYNAQTTDIPAIAGARAVKCLYKTSSKDTGIDKRDNVYVQIPDHITAEVVRDNLDDVIDYVVGFLQDAEDKIIKEKHRKGESRIYTEYLNLQKVLDYLEEQETSGRLTKEKIAAWFDDNVLEQLAEVFSTKTDDQDKIVAIITAYKNKFESLAGGRTYIKPDDREAMLKAIEIAEAGETTLGKRFIKRLTEMDNKSDEDLIQEFKL